MDIKAVVITMVFTVSTQWLFATTYTTTGDGNIDDPIWSPVYPYLSTLAAADELIINHHVTIIEEFIVRGDITIGSAGELDGGFKIKVGKDQNVGSIVVNGILSITNTLEVRGSKTVASATLPSITNNKTITVPKIQVGTNEQGSGLLTNNSSGIITAPDTHIDGFLVNLGCIIASTKLEIHGGSINGGGKVTTPELKIKSQNGRLASIGFVDVCGDPDVDPRVETTYNIDPNPPGGDPSDLADLLADDPDLTNGTTYDIDPDNFYACGVNSLGESGGPLPVELISFTGSVLNNKVLLQWSTATELNNDRFEIEKSSDGLNFEKIGVIDGNGTIETVLNYEYVDKNPLSLQGYYRLKQVDYDGQYEYSSAIIVFMGDLDYSSWQLYPNPVSINFITLKTPSQLEQGAYFTINNLNGKLVKKSELLAASNSYLLQVDVTDISGGTYVFNVINHKFTSQQLIIIAD